MVINSLRALWDEPRPAHPPARVWRDWALLGVMLGASVVEAVLRGDREGMPVAIAVSVVIGLTLLWRRTHPVAAITVAFGTLIAFDVARILVLEVTGLRSIAAALVLPYALFRWGSGREATTGLGLILVWLGVTHVADPTTPAEVVAGYGFFLFSAALGAALRFHAAGRLRAVEQAELRQRHDLARDLHDTIGHHVSGIVIQAQAGQALGAADPERGLAVLATIEAATSQALTEMRAIVGVLRDDDAPDLSPQPGIPDITRLARPTGTPRVHAQMAGTLDDVPSAVGIALYRIAQEAVTNVRRHATDATRVSIEVVGDAERVRLTVRDDGGPTASSPPPTSGLGLVGMRERTSLLGGSLDVGPDPGGGWLVEATLPKQMPTPSRARATRGTV